MTVEDLEEHFVREHLGSLFDDEDDFQDHLRRQRRTTLHEHIEQWCRPDFPPSGEYLHIAAMMAKIAREQGINAALLWKLSYSG